MESLIAGDRVSGLDYVNFLKLSRFYCDLEISLFWKFSLGDFYELQIGKLPSGSHRKSSKLEICQKLEIN